MRFNAELTALRLLIARFSAVSDGNRGDAEFKTLLDGLSGYTWVDEECRVAYECLRTVRRIHAAPLREQMAAKATRMGHPDVDWGCYFEQPAENVDIANLIRQLKTSTP